MLIDPKWTSGNGAGPSGVVVVMLIPPGIHVWIDKVGRESFADTLFLVAFREIFLQQYFSRHWTATLLSVSMGIDMISWIERNFLGSTLERLRLTPITFELLGMRVEIRISGDKRLVIGFRKRGQGQQENKGRYDQVSFEYRGRQDQSVEHRGRQDWGYDSKRQDFRGQDQRFNGRNGNDRQGQVQVTFLLIMFLLVMFSFLLTEIEFADYVSAGHTPFGLNLLLTLKPELGLLFSPEVRITGPLIERDGGDDTNTPTTKEQIKRHISAQKSLIKDYNKKNTIDPIRLNFNEEGVGEQIVRGKLYDGSADPEDHLKRFVSAASLGEWPMPVWCRMFQQTLDGGARRWFERLEPNSIDEWSELRHAFTTRYSVRKAFHKEPHKITKIFQKANELLATFKERWTVETWFIHGVLEIMKISEFIDSFKSPELAKRFLDKAPKTVDEMMRRLDDFVRSKGGFANTELLTRETSGKFRKPYPGGEKIDERFQRRGYMSHPAKAETRGVNGKASSQHIDIIIENTK
ncbi:reverse transcriptase domain-containing protein [Tanacetum coccineum]